MATLCRTCGTGFPSGASACPRCTALPAATPSQTRDAFAGKTVAGKYRIVRKLGQGGMGVVYEAEHLGVGQKVAIKFLHVTFSSDPEIVRRFHNEARSYAQIVHPHAIQLHDFGQDEEGNLFISMEYLEGDDLKRTLAREGRLAPKDVLDVVLQVCDVLGAAHARGIVHRDLKPENIMLTPSLRGYHVKVLDFGLAHLADSGTQLTAPGTVCGTPRYMAPEQAEGDEVDLRVDIYALGLVLLEALTGRHPFESPSVSETLRKQRLAPVPHLVEIAPELSLPGVDAVIQRATAKRREDRFGSMLSFAHALSPALSEAAAAKVEPGVSATSVRVIADTPTTPEGPTTPAGTMPARSEIGTPGAPKPAADAPGGAAASRSRAKPSRGLVIGFGAAIAAAAVGAFLLVRHPAIDATEARGRLDALYLANREPVPPAACQEKSPLALARLVAAAQHLGDATPEAERAREGTAALSALGEQAPGSPEASYLLAKAQALAGQPAGAAANAAILCPGFAAAENFAGNLALKDGLLDEAERRYKAAADSAPSFVKARFSTGVLKFQQGKIDEAIAALAVVLAQQPDHADAHYALARIRERKAEAARAMGDAALADREAAAARASYCRAFELGNQRAAEHCR